MPSSGTRSPGIRTACPWLASLDFATQLLTNAGATGTTLYTCAIRVSCKQESPGDIRTFHRTGIAPLVPDTHHPTTEAPETGAPHGAPGHCCLALGRYCLLILLFQVWDGDRGQAPFANDWRCPTPRPGNKDGECPGTLGSCELPCTRKRSPRSHSLDVEADTARAEVTSETASVVTQGWKQTGQV